MEALIKAGGKSSFGKYHKHNIYNNLFSILGGELKIEYNCAKQHTSIRDKYNGYFALFAGTWHKFEALTDVRLIEIYEATGTYGDSNIGIASCRERWCQYV